MTDTHVNPTDVHHFFQAFSTFSSSLLDPTIDGRTTRALSAIDMGGTAGQRRAEKAEREQAKKESAASSKKKAEEDAHWAAAGEGQKSKAAARRDGRATVDADAAAFAAPDSD